MLHNQPCTKSICLGIMAKTNGLFQIGKLTEEQMNVISCELKSIMHGKGFGDLIIFLNGIEESLQTPDPIFSQTLDAILKEVYEL